MTASAFLKARVPILAWLPAYDRAWLRFDAVAGVTTASVIISEAMAYATLARLAVQVGLYTAPLPHVHDARPAVVVLDLSAVRDVEYTGLKALIDLEASLRASGCRVVFAALNPAALAVVQRSSLGALLGRERMFFTLPQAVAAVAPAPSAA